MKIFCIGRNYSEHAKELGNEVPKNPVIFIKPDTAVLKGKDFYLPDFSSDIHDEVELVVKFNKGGKCIPAERAEEYYQEVTIGIDFTARDVQARLKADGLPWEIAKGFDGSAVVGTFMDKGNFPAGGKNFRLLKNGKVVQEGSTADMLVDIPHLIAYLSQYFTVRPGDLLFTGTPAGVGSVAENDILQGFLENHKLFDIRIQ